MISIVEGAWAIEVKIQVLYWNSGEAVNYEMHAIWVLFVLRLSHIVHHLYAKWE